MSRLKGIKFIEDFIAEGDSNHAGTFFDPKEKEDYKKTALRLSKKYPKATFGIIDYGRNMRGGGPNIDIKYGGKLENPHDDIQGHKSSFNVGTLFPTDDRKVTGAGGADIKYVTFYQNGKIISPEKTEVK